MQIRSKRTLGCAISEGEDEHSTEVILMPFEVLGSKNLPQLRKFTDRSGRNISVRTDEQAVIIASWRTLGQASSKPLLFFAHSAPLRISCHRRNHNIHPFLSTPHTFLRDDRDTSILKADPRPLAI